MDSDFFLIQKMKNGDDSAIENFVRKYYPKIFQYCLLHIRDRGDAEDLTQETFLKFFQSFEQYQHRGKCSAFLYAIASNACKDYYRKVREQYVEEVPEKAEEDQDMGLAENTDGCGERRCPAAGGVKRDGNPLFLSGIEAERDRETAGYQVVFGEIPCDPGKKTAWRISG